MKFFTTPNSKNIIAFLRIATIEKSELTFLLILYFCERNTVIFREKFFLYSEKFIIFRENCIFKKTFFISRESFYTIEIVYIQINVFIFRENVDIQRELVFTENLKIKFQIIKDSLVSLSIFDIHKENCSKD